MTVKEKEENFYQMAIDSATEQNLAIVNDYKETLIKETASYKEQVDEAIESKKKYEMEQLQREKNTTLAKKSLEIRHEYADLVLSKKEELFEEAKQKILAYCEGQDYQKKLIQTLTKDMEQYPGEECVILVMARDLSQVSNLKLLPQISVVASEEDFWGGYKMEFPKKQMIINQTYALRFAECKHEFKIGPKA